MKLWPTRKRETDTGPSMADVSIQPQISAFWDALWGSGVPLPFSPRLAERVWVANRCLQLNSQLVSSMPLRYFGPAEPSWVANPDPAWYPNGIGDAVFSAAWSMYSWGDAFLYVTSRYANGFPSAWTVLDPALVNVQVDRGRRTYRSSETPLNAEDVVQVSRDPRGNLRGTSALASYASQCWGTLASAELGRTLAGAGGIVPNTVLKSKYKLDEGQAAEIQSQWMAARARSSVGAPAVLPPDLDFEQLSFSPEDLMLLDIQQFDARVIASAFGVPAFLLNIPLEGGGLTYQNPETLFEVWWRIELRHAAGRIQRALSANMLPRGQWVEFDARAVLAPPFQEQVTAWLDLKKEGVVTVDEVRAAILHLPPVEEGEALDELTEPPSAGASPAQQQIPAATVQELRPVVTV